MTTRVMVATALVTVVSLSACGEGGPAGDAGGHDLVVRDSAGIRIVENRRPAGRAANAWRLADTPLVDLGSLEGPAATQFFQIGDGALLSDGGFVLGGFGSYDLRRFDAEGRHLWTAGREGDGPGEFEGLTSVAAAPGDALLTYDSRQRRISRWGPDGTFLASRQLEDVDGPGFPYVESLLPDGRAVYTWRTFAAEGLPPEGEIRRDTLEVRVTSPGSDEALTIGRFPGDETVIFRQSETAQGVRIISGSAPFARATHVAAHRGAVWVGDGAKPEVRRYALDGTLELIARLPIATVPVDAGMVRRALEEELAGAQDREERDLARQRWEKLALPDALPFFEELELDAAGNLWVRAFQAPGEETRNWHVLSPDGAWLGSLEVPDRYGPLAIGTAVLLARYADELDVEHVQLREIVGP
ncbi:MAG: hypothetical protein R6X22_04640 [Gemmatimonadota bacterium]